MKAWGTNKGDFSKTMSFLENAHKMKGVEPLLHQAGERGVEALRRETPKDTTLASDSWGYTLDGEPGDYILTFHNYDIEGGYNVALLIRYGHGTGTGGYVAPRDFITPALQPIFDNLADDIWKGLDL